MASPGGSPKGSPKLSFARFAGASSSLQPPPARRSASAPQPPSISIEDLTKPLTDTESHSPPGSPLAQPQPPSPLSRPAVKQADTVHAPSSERRRRGSAWERKRSPQVHWRKRWDENYDPWRHGRVLIIDCFSRDHSNDGKRKTLAYEMNSEPELREFYETGPGKLKQRGVNEHCLRIIHVQNAKWAREFLLRKFNINHRQDITGTNFGRWAIYDRPHRRAGKPVLMAKSFRNARDPWRGVSRTGFGVDYLKYYHPHVVKESDDGAEKDFKLMELNHLETGQDGEVGVNAVPAHGYDVYVQRLSVYIQRSEGPVNLSPDEDIMNPYVRSAPDVDPAGRRRSSIPNGYASDADPEKEALPLMESMDNSSTIIIFEASQTGYPEDTLVQARREIEVRWRRLMQLLPREDIALEEQLTVELMNIVMRDLFKGLQQGWEKLISKCDEHVSILEDKIYENPADESRAPELWKDSSLWLKVEKLISLQLGIIGEVQANMREMADGLEPHDRWLESAREEIKGVETMIQEQLVKPTSNLSDLMYKSVGIRDSRHSIQLGLSMWRLSWITFVFLPLTFMVGFFGMNVDAFQTSPGYPSLKWYFVAAVPLMFFVVIFYFVFKRADQDKRRDPIERGAYEHIFQEFAARYPRLWGRYGPRRHVQPKGWMSRLKWRLITRWFDPSRTISARIRTDIDEMSFWAKFKRSLASRWLGRIAIEPGSGLTAAELGEAAMAGTDEFGTVTELLQVSTPVAMAEGEPLAAVTLGSSPFRRLLSNRRSRSSSRSQARMSGDRPQSPGSAVMVEEEKTSEDESSDREDAAAPGHSVAQVGDGLPGAGRARQRHAFEEYTPVDDGPSTAGAQRDESHWPVEQAVQLLSVPMSISRSSEHAP